MVSSPGVVDAAGLHRTRTEPFLRAVDLAKSYGHVRALERACLEIHPGEVHAVVGDNGAGKSTLIKVLSGSVAPDTGHIEIDGRRVVFGGPSGAQAHGIETVYQDLALAPTLTPWANVFLGREIVHRGVAGRLGVLDKQAMSARTAEHLKTLGVVLSARAGVSVAELSGGQRQSVAIARAVMWGKRLIILDEPTAALGVRQTDMVLQLIRRVSATGVAVLLISHNLPQVLEISDRITVMRLGRSVLSRERQEFDEHLLLTAMSGFLPDDGGIR